MRFLGWVFALFLVYVFVNSDSLGREPDYYLSQVTKSLEASEFAAALAIWQDGNLGDRLVDEQVREVESLALSRVRPIPAVDFISNREGYNFLRSIDPNSNFYFEKFQHYNYRMTIGLCRSFVVFSFPPVTAAELEVSGASEFPNPREFEIPLLVDYVRAVDGTRWRYLCGISGNEIVLSGLLNNQPGRLWMNPSPDAYVTTFEIRGMNVEFTQDFKDGSKLVETVKLE